MEEDLVIGIDIGGTHLRTALVDRTGKILQQGKTSSLATGGPEQTSERLISECRFLVESAECRGKSVRAAGLGVAGKIDPSRGRVLFSPNLPAMAGFPLAPALEDALGIPVAFENDANMFGIGEAWVGAGRGIRNWIGLTLGTGVGGCLILNGRLWGGDNVGFTGEIGHMIVVPGGRACACGSMGCLEAYASGRALVEGVGEAASNSGLADGPLCGLLRSGRLTAEAVHDASAAEDPLARSLFERMGWALGLALANLFTVLGIRHAIIGGGVSAGWDQFIEPLLKSISEHSIMLKTEEVVILHSSLGDDAALLGAASLAWGLCGAHGFERQS